MRKLLAMLLLVATPNLAAADDMEKYIELLRSDLRTTKTQIHTEALGLSNEAAQEFWPIQREYETELAKLGDKRIELIKDYAGNISSMTDDTAKDLINRAFKLESDRLSLLKKYTGKISKAVSPITAARFAQIESVLNSVVDLQIRSELPFMPASTSTRTEE